MPAPPGGMASRRKSAKKNQSDKRLKHNAAEQRRSQRINEKIAELKSVMKGAGVEFTDNKFGILCAAVDLVAKLVSLHQQTGESEVDDLPLLPAQDTPLAAVDVSFPQLFAQSSSCQAIATLTRDCSCVAVNSAFRSLSGCAVLSSSRSTPLLATVCHPRDTAKLTEAIAQLRRNPKVVKRVVHRCPEAFPARCAQVLGSLSVITDARGDQKYLHYSCVPLPTARQHKSPVAASPGRRSSSRTPAFPVTSAFATLTAVASSVHSSDCGSSTGGPEEDGAGTSSRPGALPRHQPVRIVSKGTAPAVVVATSDADAPPITAAGSLLQMSAGMQPRGEFDGSMRMPAAPGGVGSPMWPFGRPGMGMGTIGGVSPGPTFPGGPSLAPGGSRLPAGAMPPAMRMWRGGQAPEFAGVQWPGRVGPSGAMPMGQPAMAYMAFGGPGMSMGMGMSMNSSPRVQQMQRQAAMKRQPIDAVQPQQPASLKRQRASY